jgi:hypothetical protein
MLLYTLRFGNEGPYTHSDFQGHMAATSSELQLSTLGYHRY